MIDSLHPRRIQFAHKRKKINDSNYSDILQRETDIQSFHEVTVMVRYYMVDAQANNPENFG